MEKSQSDNRNVVFLDSPEHVDLEQLQALLNLGTFWARDRSIADLSAALAHSNPVVTAWHGPRLIGHARATSDTVYRAAIWDVVVHPEYRGSGIGRKLVQTVLAHPAVCRVERVYLTTTNQQRFYEQIGFTVNPTTTMVLSNHQTLDARELLARFSVEVS
ncbi:MAG: GNAT family N-acetyltransferase [Pseudanabaenaceae cyanobacterium]